MAVTADMVNSQLQLVFENGTDDKGNVKYRRKSFNNVKMEATEEQLYKVAVAIEALQENLLSTIERNDRSVLVDL
ncbi:hypothetical protein GCM10010954_08940 [Halobacillus andaensis]|uniref:DUF1659 domain-containing protein n=1 Tax=Halobacillus andaensis TaxID=1176239 RepID=A0A917B1V2_HALAA|nr:DUF1659 domain-containing protein [Halobacillus andaensis]MBP2003683.1 hypothetical protein [Halobacillus andaensis]GGF12453.1 hypothetical protein GCM10010954_08940 [Halobacillus andaensis]